MMRISEILCSVDVSRFFAARTGSCRSQSMGHPTLMVVDRPWSIGGTSDLDLSSFEYLDELMRRLLDREAVTGTASTGPRTPRPSARDWGL